MKNLMEARARKTELSEGKEAVVCALTSTPSAPHEFVSSSNKTERVYRHRLPVRIGHWLNVVCLFILIMSGLQIFNAHPALYWGDRSDLDHSLFSIRPMTTDNGEVRGVMNVLGHAFDTTGVLGYSNGSRRAFPAWATIPSAKWLAMGRQWHLFFAWVFVINGVLFAGYALVSRHVKKDLLPTGRDLGTIPKTVKDHLVLRHPRGEEAKRYNVLQKLSYLGVIFGLAPLIVLTGLTMSPTIDTAFPWLLTIFGGRQAARTIHFIACFSFIGFIVIHVSQVILTGLFNNIRSMVTGYFVVKHEGANHGA